jgi:hypothetical protein
MGQNGTKWNFKMGQNGISKWHWSKCENLNSPHSEQASNPYESYGENLNSPHSEQASTPCESYESAKWH